MAKFKEKSELIDGVKWNGKNLKEVQDFCGEENVRHLWEDGLEIMVSPNSATKHYGVLNIGGMVLRDSNGKFTILTPNQADSYEPTEDITDGYHTFNELYYYRMLYNAAMFNELSLWYDYKICKSKRHSNGELCFGGDWFVVVAQLPTGQITNHYEMKYWDLFNIQEVDRAPYWDGHTPQEASKRLLDFIKDKYKN